MTDRLDVDQLTDADHRRLWTAVVTQALKDLRSSNGVAGDARDFLASDRAAWILEELGWPPAKVRRVLATVLDSASP